MKTPDSLYPSNYDDEIGPLELGAEWWRERCRELQHNLKIADDYRHADKLDFEMRIEDCSKIAQRLLGEKANLKYEVDRLNEYVDSLEASLRLARQDALEEAAKAIREQCSVCGGSGLADGSHPASYVTREMAMDAGDLSLEGSIWQQEEIIECEYCGRPISVVRSLKEKP